jgi:tetratricopeptide (TPR) repeat protein
LPGLTPRLLDALAHSARQHRNGRANVAATAAPLGLHPRRVRQFWEEAAARLGYGDEYLQFWRQRLGEALTGLAADLLRDRGQCLLLAGPRNRPDPAGRLRRIRRIRSQLMVRPLPPDLRRALSPSLRRGGVHGLDPRALLAHAAALQPDSPAVWSWSFEAAVARGDLRAAAADLLRARDCGGDAVSQTLARARLLEARGRHAAALALLGRALARLGDAGAVRLRNALAAAGQPPSTGGGDNAAPST